MAVVEQASVVEASSMSQSSFVEVRLVCFRSSSTKVGLLAGPMLGLVAGSAGVGPIVTASAEVNLALVESAGLVVVSPIAAASVGVELTLVESAGLVVVSPIVAASAGVELNLVGSVVLVVVSPIAAASVGVELILVESAELVEVVHSLGIEHSAA